MRHRSQRHLVVLVTRGGSHFIGDILDSQWQYCPMVLSLWNDARGLNLQLCKSDALLLSYIQEHSIWNLEEIARGPRTQYKNAANSENYPTCTEQDLCAIWSIVVSMACTAAEMPEQCTHVCVPEHDNNNNNNKKQKQKQKNGEKGNQKNLTSNVYTKLKFEFSKFIFRTFF